LGAHFVVSGGSIRSADRRFFGGLPKPSFPQFRKDTGRVTGKPEVVGSSDGRPSRHSRFTVAKRIISVLPDHPRVILAAPRQRPELAAANLMPTGTNCSSLASLFLNKRIAVGSENNHTYRGHELLEHTGFFQSVHDWH
jgi:hypothetical protein